MDYTLIQIRQFSTRGATLPCVSWCLCVSLLGELTTIITTATVLLQHQPPLVLFTSHLFSAIFFFPIIDLTPLSIIRHLVPRPEVRSPGYHHRSVAALRTLARNSTPQRLSSPLFSSPFLFLFLSPRETPFITVVSLTVPLYLCAPGCVAFEGCPSFFFDSTRLGQPTSSVWSRYPFSTTIDTFSFFFSFDSLLG